MIDRVFHRLDYRLVACAVASVVGHFALARVLETLPPRDEPAPRRPIEVRVVAPPPPAPAPEPPPPAPTPVPEVHEPRPRVARPARVAAATTATTDAPPTSSSVTADPTAKPVFGVTMESTSTAGGPPVPVGNTTAPQPAGTQTVAKPLGVAAAHEVTKMPLPLGRCAGKYTDAARAAGVEGTVVLDLVVDASGVAREIQVVDGLPHGLTDAAVAALRACRFTPGEKNGEVVAVRIRGFKIRFVLQDN